MFNSSLEEYLNNVFYSKKHFWKQYHFFYSKFLQVFRFGWKSRDTDPFMFRMNLGHFTQVGLKLSAATLQLFGVMIQRQNITIIFTLSSVPLDLGKVGGTGCLDLKMVKICNFKYFRSQAQCPYASGALIRIYFHPKAAEKMAPPCMARLDLVNCSWECDGSADCSDDHGDVGDLVKGDAQTQLSLSSLDGPTRTWWAAATPTMTIQRWRFHMYPIV